MRQSLVIASATAVLCAVISVRAQQQPPANLVPMTAASLAAQTDRYVGQVVAVYAPVEALLSRTTFALDQDAKATSSAQVLVVSPTLVSAPKAQAYVTVVGRAMRFTPEAVADAAKGYALDLPPDMVERFRGQAMVLATNIYDATMTDLAFLPPPPLSKEEVAFDAVMKQVNPTLGELRKGLDAADVAVVKEQGSKLRNLFADTQKFFAARKTVDAEGWAREAIGLVEAVTSQATGNNWPAARETSGKIQSLCQSCHTVHRERGADGQYRVKR